MCQSTLSPHSHVRIVRCPHGSNFVTLGPATLQMTDAQLVLLDRAIHKLAEREPPLQRTLYEALCQNHQDPEWEGQS